MEIKVSEEEEAPAQPLIKEEEEEDKDEEALLLPDQPRKTAAQKAIRKTFKGTAHLSNLLPTGSVLAFQFLAPIFTQQGKCGFPRSQALTVTLLAGCGISCFVLCFTDSFRDEKGKVRYGLATFRGLWVMDRVIPPETAEKYKVRFIDFFHAAMSVLIFAAVALLDQNVARCFFPEPSETAKTVLARLPVAVGLIGALFFVAFPTNRHGIGFPLSRN